MTSRLLQLLLLVSLVLAQGCGPIRSTLGLIRADQALTEAREMAAQEHAPYAMTLAEALRDKAWEEQGYGEYDTSMHMAAEAETLAREAIQITRQETVPPLPEPPPLEEAPAADAPTEEAPASEAPAEEPPAEDAPAEEPPAEEAPAEDAPAEPPEDDSTEDPEP